MQAPYTIPVDPLLADDAAPPSEHYIAENAPAWNDELLDALELHGYKREWWPDTGPSLARYAKKRGQLPTTMPTNVKPTHGAYTGPAVHDLVRTSFNKNMHFMTIAFYVLVQPEDLDWWPHEPAFLAHDPNSYMKYFLYERAKRDRSVLLTVKRSAGRPRTRTPELPNAAYQEWLAACAAHRKLIATAEARVQEARAACLTARAAAQELRAAMPKYKPD